METSYYTILGWKTWKVLAALEPVSIIFFPCPNPLFSTPKSFLIDSHILHAKETHVFLRNELLPTRHSSDSSSRTGHLETLKTAPNSAKAFSSTTSTSAHWSPRKTSWNIVPRMVGNHCASFWASPSRRSHTRVSTKVMQRRIYT